MNESPVFILFAINADLYRCIISAIVGAIHESPALPIFKSFVSFYLEFFSILKISLNLGGLP